MTKLLTVGLWVAIGVLGAVGFGVLALSRGESINAGWIIVAGVCTYLVAYRFYSRFLAETVFGLDNRRATPAERLNNGRDFHPTNRGWRPDITSRPFPARARWLGRRWRRSSDSFPERFG